MTFRISLLTLAFTILISPGAAFAQSPAPMLSPLAQKKRDHLMNNPRASEQPAEDKEETEERAPTYADAVEETAGTKRILETRGDKTKPSALESMYAKRSGAVIEQFGYDLFGVPREETQAKLDSAGVRNSLPPMGEVQDDFILSAGDELEVTLTGQRAERKIYKIDSRGMLMIPDFPPIPAEGRSIGGVRVSVQSAADALHNTEAYVTLSSVRQIGILIIGHVKRPGRQTLTVFHSALDALMEAGGIQKSGSLRQIKLVRNGRGMMIDLYDLLLRGESSLDLRLKDGDRIIVPGIGPTVAVSGEVKRPGIYELLPAVAGMYGAPDKSEKISLNDMLELGGGVLAPGKNRFLRLDITPDGKESVTETRDNFHPMFGDGSLLMVSKGNEKRAGMVELKGATRRPGLHALAENKSLRKLINSEDVLDSDVYPLIGLIERRDSERLASSLIDFPLKLVLSGDYDRKLEDADVVRLFTYEQIKALNNPEDVEPAAGDDDEAQDEDALSPEIADFLKERSAFVRGAVRSPGPYPVAEGVTLDALLDAAGGLTLEASTPNIEVASALQGEGLQTEGRSGTRRIKVDFRDTSPGDVPIGAGDAVRVNQKFQRVEDKSVLIMGEVANPGRYDLLPGDKISDLLNRAGGLTAQAYPDGAIFSRESERKAEEARFHSQAIAVKRAISAALEQDDKKVDSGKIAEARALAEELGRAQGVGRITVEANPANLEVHPELDMLLESGDRLYIPKRALTVRVNGEVLSPASLQFREGKKPLDYIHEAGGFSFGADKDRTFVVFPDGSAQPLKVSSWNHNAVFIPPGSSIIVPRDPEPFDFIESAKDVSQILSNLAITAIFIDDVRNDD